MIGIDLIGDILSPVITLVTFIYILKGFFLTETDKTIKYAGLFLSISVLMWFISDTMWGISTILLNVNPDENIVITVGYALSNLFMLASLLIFVYTELKKWNRIQVLLDSMIIAVCVAVLVWVIIFEQDLKNAQLLLNDGIAMFSMFADIATFALVVIWFFSKGKGKSEEISLSLKHASVGIVIFIIVDIIYYYVYFYRTYNPNTLLDGGYIVAFLLIAAAAKIKLKPKTKSDDKKRILSFRFGKELILIAVPVILVLVKGTHTDYLLYIISCIMLYFVFSTYVQKNIFKDELHLKEKEYIRQLEQKVEERTKEVVLLLNTDVITELCSRRYLCERMEMISNNLSDNENMILFYIDLNKYKYIKTMYGNYMGELLLKQVADKLRTYSYEGEGILASYGEDIFILAVKGSFSYNRGEKMGMEIIDLCSEIYYVESQEIMVTINIGISIYPNDAVTVPDLIKHADIAMMQARSIGFNRALAYKEELGTIIFNKNKIEMKLKQVKFDEEFMLYYQPQVLCNDGSLVGFEALIRWRTKSGEFISPNDFIPITEETGLIIPLGYWILNKAMEQLELWNQQGFTNIRLAINISVRQLNDSEFITKLSQLLELHHIAPETIELEITENVQLEESANIKRVLWKIRNMGMTIAVDDFGTGYSSLYYLKHLPINRIKLAKPLIDRIEEDSYDRTIVKTVIIVAKTRGIKVIAEGVETKEQWECLKALECDEIQGFYFAKPMPPIEAGQFALQKSISLYGEM